ncbi:tRNA (N6-isopentenyl adenosine(37)-C2)-methylthiotransferase MiaB [Candidatus Babeliales bacterium]|nr:tRNA (N6-isopentenyl adenosine(37)-C2)-methylthiotransferase MiaB [Candidatus Babeliales bacterium]
MIKIFFKTYGCQANVADSNGFQTYLVDLGCKVVDSESEADLIIVNSCAIRERAELKLFSYVGSLNHYKKEKAYIRIGVIGCVASYRKQEIYERFDHVNFVFGARDNIETFKAYLADIVVSLESTKRLYLDTSRSIRPGQDRDIQGIVEKKHLKIRQKEEHKVEKNDNLEEVRRAFVNIVTGCNNYCSYCIVPFTRGRETSYSIDSIVRRIEREIQLGAKEINLVGQNVNSYIDPNTGASFADLLKVVARLEGDFWVRYISPHPKDMTRDVLEVMAEHKDKLCNYVHMPLQAGSDKILKAMNRIYTVDRYMEIIGWIKEFLPEATITTDIIVGFPGESEEDYLGTMNVVEKVKYDLVYSFIYSRRKYTKAFNMPDDTTIEVKQERLDGLQKRAKELSFERNYRFLGKVVRSLVEKRLPSGKLLARTAGNQRVIFDEKDQNIGKFVNLKIDKIGLVNLDGSLK